MKLKLNLDFLYHEESILNNIIKRKVISCSIVNSWDAESLRAFNFQCNIEYISVNHNTLTSIWQEQYCHDKFLIKICCLYFLTLIRICWWLDHCLYGNSYLINDTIYTDKILRYNIWATTSYKWIIQIFKKYNTYLYADNLFIIFCTHTSCQDTK